MRVCVHACKVSYAPGSPSEYVVRKGSVKSNHPKLMCRTFPHHPLSALKWFKKVRGGSIWLNHSKLV